MKEFQFTTADNAVEKIKSGDRVFLHSAAMTPHTLVNAMCDRYSELRGVEIVHIHTEGPAPYVLPEMRESFFHNACFVGANVRQAVQTGIADYIPVFLSEMPLLFKRGILPIDVAMISVSPPDKHGFCSLGSSVDISVAAIEAAKMVIAEVNPNIPRTHGDGYLHFSRIDYAIAVNTPIHEVKPKAISSTEQKIGRYIADMVEDGATLQMGIGAIPDAVLAELGSHKKLGVHTEMFSDGVIDLVEKGVITGEMKKVLPNVITACFAMGSKRLYDFIDDNPSVIFKESTYTNDTSRIRRNPKVTAINSAIEIDLTGQVCADSIGSKQFSGVGGQMDFIRGASLSEGGKPIIAMSSITRNGESKLVSFLKPGASVTTTRAHVHYVVTENGVANLYGKNLRQRAKALIAIAHPTHQEMLEKAAFERFVGVGV
ncbi:acetyl-CoA hydrolase/transferase family protein [Cryomorpha ignava]|uniref:Acetyl-CoA hydrolase/transferase family protein n=1 Tax=Cryomorpha ignava TaxID=101383 RepID=A0A7K3WUY1_9FLAO|nr:acetyl-CoA hydrolase/transferase family protein [Cryomorpha ignava]NEN25489.1 acetyl-CoA hydrolase/transferase family protein [Cryomorpha ignava]